MWITIDVILGLICLAGGLFLGFFPLKRSQMDHQQEQISSTVGFVFAVVFVALMVMNRTVETWIIVIALLCGFGFAKIPSLLQWARRKWDIFRPQ